MTKNEEAGDGEMLLDTKDFTWKITNFSKLKDEIYSDAFVAGGHRWRVLCFPKGNDVDFLSLYLDFADWESHASSMVVGVSNAAPEKVIEAEAEDQSKGDSTSPSLSGKVARTSTITSPSSSSLQFTSKNLIAELSTIASIWGSTSVDGIPVSKTNDATNHHVSALPQQERDKLIEFLEMSLEAISQHNRFDNVHDLVLKISEHATDPFEKTVLKDLLSRVVEFKNTIPRSLSMIETSHEVEASSAQATKELEGSLVRRQKQLAFLESEVSRIEEVVMKVEAELQLLGALKQKLVDEKSLTVAEMEITNREACRELGELKSKHRTQASQGE
ncbi:MATH domain and coiled-coil domain-containing protein At3g58360 [Linum perenne]